MNSSKNSLCNTCEHLTNCCLTDDKSFIWSCSEYQEKGVNGEISKHSISKVNFNLAISDTKPELV